MSCPEWGARKRGGKKAWGVECLGEVQEVHGVRCSVSAVLDESVKEVLRVRCDVKVLGVKARCGIATFKKSSFVISKRIKRLHYWFV